MKPPPSAKNRNGDSKPQQTSLKPKPTAGHGNKRKGVGGGPKSSSGGTDFEKKKRALEIQIEDDVPSFPRGGGGGGLRREVEEVRDAVEERYEYEEEGVRKHGKKKQKKKMKKREDADEDLGSLFGDSIVGKLPRFANRITLKNVSPGMKLWGVVSEVNEKDLAISLPGGLRGLVRASEASDLTPDCKDKVTVAFWRLGLRKATMMSVKEKGWTELVPASGSSGKVISFSSHLLVILLEFKTRLNFDVFAVSTLVSKTDALL